MSCLLGASRLVCYRCLRSRGYGLAGHLRRHLRRDGARPDDSLCRASISGSARRRSNGCPTTARRTSPRTRSTPQLPCFTPVRSPESNGIAEAFVKTFKRDYARLSILPNAETVIALRFLASDLNASTLQLLPHASRCAFIFAPAGGANPRSGTDLAPFCSAESRPWHQHASNIIGRQSAWRGAPVTKDYRGVPRSNSSIASATRYPSARAFVEIFLKGSSKVTREELAGDPGRSKGSFYQ